MSFRKYELGPYEDMVRNHSWDVPERYNIAHDVCDKHERDRPAMVWEDYNGDERRVTFGDLQDLSNRFANVLESEGVEREDRVATLLPSLPETAAVFLGTFKRGSILLSMSVLYGDDGIRHRLDDSGATVLVTDKANASDRSWSSPKLTSRSLPRQSSHTIARFSRGCLSHTSTAML